MSGINHIEVVQQVLSAGGHPTIDQLGNALAQSIADVNFKNEVINDMTAWLGRLSSAHLRKDAALVHSILEEFVTTKVKIVVANEKVH